MSEGHRRTGKAVMGGVPLPLAAISTTQIAAHVQGAIDEMAGRWLLLAADCSIEIATPPELLLAAGDAANRPVTA